jgi:hypothetical protein
MNSADAGGSDAFRRAPVSRMRDSKSTPAASAFVIPEISTTSAFVLRIDRASPSVFEFPYSMPG